MTLQYQSHCFEEPVLARRRKLSRPLDDYFPEGVAAWVADVEARDKQVFALNGGRGVFFGPPRPDEQLVAFRVSEGRLDDEKDAAPAPWGAIPVVSSPRKERDGLGLLSGLNPRYRVVHWDPLDADGGLEAIDIENRVVAHETFDFYTRPPLDALLGALGWFERLVGAWQDMSAALLDVVSCLIEAKARSAVLGFQSEKAFMSAAGIYMPGLSGLRKVLENPEDLGLLWQEGVSPFLLAKALSMAGEDVRFWMGKLRRAAVQTRPDGDAAVAELLAELREAFPPKARTKHFVILPADTQIAEMDGEDGPVETPEGPPAVIVEGKIAGKRPVDPGLFGAP